VDRFDTPQWQVEWAHQLIDAGATIYAGHGDPALHAVEIYKGRPILYGLGNYILPRQRNLWVIDTSSDGSQLVLVAGQISQSGVSR
jgi:poly-gamma-glutamate capsule biosynthesis protein CapA/YwtB (metallophosphatase superfamily)